MNLAWLMFWMLFAPSPTRHTVKLHEFQFKPAVVRAAVGDTIIWENLDIVPHTADANQRAWSSGNIPGRSKAMTVVTRKGEQEFTCLYHSNMKGKLVVK